MQKRRHCTVKTGDVASVTRTTANCSGEILSQGDSEVTERGICWATTDKPLLTDNIKVDDSEDNSFTVDLTDLEPDTEYFVRAYATNTFGTGYGSIKSFTTDPASIPEVTTSQVTSITCTTATSGGKITSGGASQIIDRGICWSMSENPDLTDNYISVGTVLNPFSYIIKDLEPDTDYFIAAYATNLIGTGYGDSKQFRTSAPDPQYDPNSILGIWEWINDIGGQGVTYPLVGQTYIREYTPDSLEILTINGNIYWEKKFHIEGDILSYPLENLIECQIKISGDTLICNCTSGFTGYSKRLY